MHDTVCLFSLKQKCSKAYTWNNSFQMKKDQETKLHSRVWDFV